MPRRTDIESILIIGAGPIVIGQACEFDYSGVQAVKALKEEGYRIILVNSNPATIMTDPGLADATYVEPITPEMVAKVIEKERPDALLPTMGGQTALNCALELDRRGVLDLFEVEMIGAKADVIDKAEDRERFREAMDAIGLENPQATVVSSPKLTDENGRVYGYDRAAGYARAMEALAEIGLPAIIRPAFTLGGTGGGIAYNMEEYEQFVRSGIDASPVGQVLIDESLLGWKEYEMEVVRDKNDNCIIICSIENIDPMGVHTGDSITVAPALTLTDKEYQRMRTASLEVLREIGVETGGSNVQFAVNPKDGRMVVIEMNPRVSRSSALASKATGFPIAKVAAKLAVGYTLDEIENEITGGATPASFEPTIDYVVTKIPRFAFEKYPGAENQLNTSMKSVGEAMAIGRTFQESVQKALRSLETGLSGFDEILAEEMDVAEDQAGRSQVILAALSQPTPDRLLVIAQAFREGLTVEAIQGVCAYEPWFLRQIEEIVEAEEQIRLIGLPQDADALRAIKAMGFSDARLAVLGKTDEDGVRALRHRLGVRPVFKRVDTCAAEFASATPYMYSTYETGDCESAPSQRKKAIILGGGPNRIGQGIEFDYCCCHAAFAFEEMGLESIMVNCNPETVSTDYDTADRLYFEPLTTEDVLELITTEQANGTLAGVVVQYGGQTPLKLSSDLEKAGVPILGTSPDAIDLAEDRERFKALLEALDIKQPPNAIARSEAEAAVAARQLGFPLVLRPSFVLGGRGMEIVRDTESFERYIREAVHVSGAAPLLLDRYLSDAAEIDVDAVCDGEDVWVAGVMEHIEEAGVHSGDSACSLPPHSLTLSMVEELERQTVALAKAIGVRGLMNVQYAVKGETIYVLEVNPRASRTVPFVAKAIGAPVAKIAAKVMAGTALKDLPTPTGRPSHMAVKEAVMPFARFPGVDPVLGPEMRSTGEVMGIDASFEGAFAKAQQGAGVNLPRTGKVFVSLKDGDKDAMIPACKTLVELGFDLLATGGTAKALSDAGVTVQRINKVFEGRPHVVDAIKNGEVKLVFNTTEGQRSLIDSFSIRRTSLELKVPCYTTASAARAAVKSIAAIDEGKLEPRSLQSYSTGSV